MPKISPIPFVVLVIFLIVGLFVGLAGWVKIDIDTTIQIAAQAPTSPVTYDGVTFNSASDLVAILSKQAAQQSIFGWVFSVPTPLPQVISSMGFGLVGAVAAIFFGITFQKQDFQTILPPVVRVISGALTALVLLAVLYLLPQALTVDGKLPRPATILLISLLAGGFSDQIWSRIQDILKVGILTPPQAS